MTDSDARKRRDEKSREITKRLLAKITNMSQYAERNARELEPYYSKHVLALTAEGLHSKADIAKELAYRDRIIADLHKQLLEIKEALRILKSV